MFYTQKPFSMDFSNSELSILQSFDLFYLVDYYEGASMNEQNQSSNPENIVSNIVGKKIYLENMASPTIDVVKEIGAKQIAYGDKFIWLIECIDENGLIYSSCYLDLKVHEVSATVAVTTPKQERRTSWIAKL